MASLIIGGAILSAFFAMFYIEDRMGGGLYDPDPTASYRYKNKNKN